MKKTIIFIIIFLILIPILIISPSSFFNKGNKTITAQGTLNLVGNEPFTDVVLVSNKIYYYLPEEFKKNYLEFFDYNVEVQGDLQQIVLESADHKYKIPRNILTNIKIKKLSKRENY